MLKCFLLDHLWTQHELDQIILTTKKVIPLPKSIEAKVLQSVVALLLTGSINRTLATRCYLEPLNDHENIYRFKKIVYHGQHAKVVRYYIGKYGACPAAIRDVARGFNLHDITSAVITDQCFPNLGAIISVGVASGVENKVKIYDVLVSSEVVNCEKSSDENGEYLCKGGTIIVSDQLIKLFTQSVQWPNDAIKKRSSDNGISLPDVKSGVILSLPFLIDDLAMKKRLVTNFVPKAIGIEMEGAYLYAEAQQTMADTIIVQGVCDFGDRNNSNEYQPTAALLAADLVHTCLSDSQAYQMFEGLHKLFV